MKHPLELVIYRFDGVQEHKVYIRPHGNAKSDQPYYRTMKNMLHQQLKSSSPKDAIYSVTEAKGGIITARSAGELPLSQQQVYNINHKRKLQALQAGTCTSLGYARGSGRDL